MPIGSQTKVMLGMVGWLIATGSTEKQAMSSPWRGFAVAWGCSLVISEPLVSSVTLPWERDPARPTPERQPPPARAEGGVRFFKAGEAIRTPGIPVARRRSGTPLIGVLRDLFQRGRLQGHMDVSMPQGVHGGKFSGGGCVKNSSLPNRGWLSWQEFSKVTLLQVRSQPASA